MVGGEFGKVTKGQRLSIPASSYNRFVDAAKAHAESVSTGPPSLAGPSQYNIVLIRNDSGADRGRFDVLGLDDLAITPTGNLDEFARVIVFAGAAPTIEHTGRPCVLVEPVLSGQIGRAVVDGITQVRVKMLDDRDPCADVDESDPSRLRSSMSGAARLLWTQPRADRDDPTVAWAVARLGPVPERTMRVVITATEEIGPNRWKYSWIEARWIGGQFVPVSGSYTSAAWGFAYNGIENANSDSGKQGGGIDVANLEGTFAHQPINPGASITIRGPVYADGEPAWFFDAVNNVDGDCEP